MPDSFFHIGAREVICWFHICFSIILFLGADTRPLLVFSADTSPIRAVAWAPGERSVT